MGLDHLLGKMYLRWNEGSCPSRGIGAEAVPVGAGIGSVGEVLVAVQARGGSPVSRFGVEVSVPFRRRVVEAVSGQVLSSSVRANKRHQLRGREALGGERRHDRGGVVVGARHLVGRVGCGRVGSADHDVHYRTVRAGSDAESSKMFSWREQNAKRVETYRPQTGLSRQRPRRTAWPYRQGSSKCRQAVCSRRAQCTRPIG